MTEFIAGLRAWTRRRWLFAAGTAAITFLVIALPTDLIPNPIAGRDVPPTSWAIAVLAVSAVLSGLLAATYVATPLSAPREGKAGLAASVLTFFAVGCPVCNKLALLALGYTGALRYFGPVQPYLAVVAIGLLAWALINRVRKESACDLKPRASVAA